MGKHSNIIFTDADGMIIDSIKHISHLVSSVREVLPGKAYVYPPSGDKRPPYDADRDYFISTVYTKPVTVNDHSIRIREDNITVLTHDLYDKFLSAAGAEGESDDSSEFLYAAS